MCPFFYFVQISDPLMEPYPHQFATALFSFLYHLASYDAGGEALVSCGMMEALLKVSFYLLLIKDLIVSLENHLISHIFHAMTAV